MSKPARGIALEQEDVMHAPHSVPTNGYLGRQSRHPGLLATAVVLHVGVLGAILSYHPEILIKPEDGIILREFPPIEVPPPAETDKKPKQQQAKAEPQPQPDRPETIIPTQTTTNEWPEQPRHPPIEIDVGNGGTATEVLPVRPVLTNASSDPRFIRDLQPPYPPGIERLEIEGSVTVRIQIGVDGRVTAVELVKADDPAFFASTRDWALKRWRYKPATRDSEAVVSWLIRTVHFRIVHDRNG
jgi:protein TonB